MAGLGNPELIIILFIVLLMFGGRKLPELARSMGSAVKEFTKASRDTELKEKSQEDEENKAIIEAAKKLGIDVEGRDINEIAREIVKATEKKEK